MTTDWRRWRITVSAGQTRCRCGGAEGIRTPDLLIAKVPRADVARALSASPMPPFHRHSDWGHTSAAHDIRPSPCRAYLGHGPGGAWGLVMTLHKLHAGDGYTYCPAGRGR